jgi:putative SOS response-associated peptidase YedK
MCGRFLLAADTEKIAEHFGVILHDPLPLRYNIAPGQSIAVIRCAVGETAWRFDMLRWGLIPSWAADPKIGYRLINARVETVFEKPAFRDAIYRRRCLIPATGFYEWQRDNDLRTPFCFSMKDGSVFALAGIWETWRTQTEVVESCSILTTAASEIIEDIHDRMPVILQPESYQLWLNPPCQQRKQILQTLQTISVPQMVRRQVSSRVNSIRFDDAECAQTVISV